MDRPPVDVVVPFRGEPAELREVTERLASLQLGPGDSLIVVDNGPASAPPVAGPVRVLRAAEIATPGFARNRGVSAGSAEWIVFIDADVVPPPDLLDSYFDPPPGERTALIAGGVRDEPAPPNGNAAARYMYMRAGRSQEHTLRYGRWGFPQTANAACRRAAFEAVGGFREDIRAAEDADLTFRLRAAGWELERREDAAVVHLARRNVRSLLAQRLCHGAGAAWLSHRYPGVFPPRRRPGLVWWGVRTAAAGLVSAAGNRDRDEAIDAVLEPLDNLAYEFGRSLPNERPLPRRWWWRR